MSIELKIKSKHLALEPDIIRKEENKLKARIDHYKMKHQIADSEVWEYYTKYPDLYKMCSKRGSLISHRRWDVRNEARATYLARAYLKGMPYKVVEPNVKDNPWLIVMTSMVRMVMKYGTKNYYPDYVKTDKGDRRVARTAEDKAKEDILKWMNEGNEKV